MIRNPLLGDNFNPAALKELTSHIEKSQSENNHTWSEIKEKEVGERLFLILFSQSC